MNVYQKPETDIILCDSMMDILVKSKDATRMVVEPASYVDPWDSHAGLSEYNTIWDEEEEDNDVRKLKN